MADNLGGRPGRGRARGRVMVNPSNPGNMPGYVDAAPSESVSGRCSAVEEERGGPSEVASVGSRSASSLQEGGSSVVEVGSSGRDADAASTITTTSVSEAGRGLRVTLKEGFIKQGKLIKNDIPVSVFTNYLHMNKTPDFQLYQYRVDFSPEEDDTDFKKQLLRAQEGSLGRYMFDGHMLYTPRPIPQDKRELQATNGKANFTIIIKSVGFVLPDSPMYIQFYNMMMRKCMTLIGMEEVGRHFYDRKDRISFKNDRLELWPGIITAIRKHEVGMLLCIEVTHKVLRLETVFEMIKRIKDSKRNKVEFEDAVKKELVGVIVITHYNRKTYRIDDIDFNITPDDTFKLQDNTEKKYKDYYREKYGIQIDSVQQPALVSNPRKRDVNKGITSPIILFPSLCNPTGLTDEMRKNFPLMKKLSEHLHMGPNQRKAALDKFVNKLRDTPAVQAEFDAWDVQFVPDYVLASARQFEVEGVAMGPPNSKAALPDRSADWTRQLKGRHMLEPMELVDWVIFVPSREAQHVPSLKAELMKQADAMNIRVSEPMATISYEVSRIGSVIRNELRVRKTVKFAYLILPNNNVHTYAEVKKICILEYGIGCQGFLAKHMNKGDPKALQKLGSICTKVMIQITAKLGGIPWAVNIPVKKMMILGFDVYHCSERKGQSVGALVSTTDYSLTKYFSTTTFHKDKSELANNLTAGMLRSLEAHRQSNKGELPNRIVLFRDGVGEGQINYVVDCEVPQIRKAICEAYNSKQQEQPILSVIIVTKKINSRMLLEKKAAGQYDNVNPGTVLDNTITLPERYDYFLVSQSVNQGTVSPTNYNVVYDESDWPPERMQRLSYKLCHLYYNWCGTVAVPAPCQYAHKLAYLTGISLNDSAPIGLSKNLWYL